MEAGRWQTLGSDRYSRNDVMQQIVPFVLHANSNATLAGEDRADILTAHHIVLAKVENMSTINCSNVVAFAQVSTKPDDVRVLYIQAV